MGTLVTYIIFFKNGVIKIVLHLIKISLLQIGVYQIIEFHIPSYPWYSKRNSAINQL